MHISRSFYSWNDIIAYKEHSIPSSHAQALVLAAPQEATRGHAECSTVKLYMQSKTATSCDYILLPVVALFDVHCDAFPSVQFVMLHEWVRRCQTLKAKWKRRKRWRSRRRAKQLANIQHTVAKLDDTQMLNRYVYGPLSGFYLTLWIFRFSFFLSLEDTELWSFMHSRASALPTDNVPGQWEEIWNGRFTHYYKILLCHLNFHFVFYHPGFS